MPGAMPIAHCSIAELTTSCPIPRTVARLRQCGGQPFGAEALPVGRPVGYPGRGAVQTGEPSARSCRADSPVLLVGRAYRMVARLCSGVLMRAETIRVWIDDRHPIFRRGLRTCLAVDGVTVIGESNRFDPIPESDADVLVFEVDGGGLQRAVKYRAAGDVRLVAIIDSRDEGALYDAVDAGVCAIHLRTDVQPDALVHSVRAAYLNNTTLPIDLIPRLMRRAATSAGTSNSTLQPRELAVLQLLASGNDTLNIASELSYSERTVKNIVHDLLMKLNCRNRAHAVAMATRQGII